MYVYDPKKGEPFDITAYLIDRCRERFLEDSNPLHIWAAYRLARRRSLPILSVGGALSAVNVEPAPVPMTPLPLPEWVAAYFDECADSLLSGADAEEALFLTIRAGSKKHSQIVNLERNEGMIYFIDRLLSMDPKDALKIVQDIDAEAAVVFEGGGSRLDLICEFVADQTKREDNPFSTKALSSELVRSTYYRLKDKV